MARAHRWFRHACTLIAAVGISAAPRISAQPEPACAGSSPAQTLPLAATNAPLSIVGLEGLFDTFPSLDSNRADCVALIETEDAPDIREDIKKPGGLWKVRRLVARITALSDANCFLFHYTQLKRDTFACRPHVKAIVLRAWKKPRHDESREELYALIRGTKIPMIGFCGGFHQIYYAYGGEGTPLRRLRPGEKDPNPAYNPGVFKEWGPTKIKITARDPLLDGFGESLVLHEMHAFQCSRLPQEFINMAETDECHIQIIKHRDKALYGTQSHPEVYDDSVQDGKRLLLNFFKIAGLAGNLSR